MSQPRHRPYQMGGGNNAGGHGQFGDTTYTKIFVGGLAWETQRDTMRRYFEQFGEIQEAVVITDKNTGRSKGYGFVTFRDPDSAIGACQDPSPVIDGRRANCNLASLGAQQRPTRPSAPQHHGMGRYRPALMAPPAAYQGSSSGYFHQQPHYAYPYSPYGYSGYPQDNMYPMNYYNVYGGQQQYPPYYTAAASASTPPGVYPNFYPFYAQSSQATQAQGYGIQYPQMVQYPYVPPGILSAPTSVPSTTSNTTGVTTSPVGVAGTSTTSQTAAATTTTTTEHGSSPS